MLRLPLWVWRILWVKEVSMAEKWSSGVGGETKRQHVETSETGRWHLYRGKKVHLVLLCSLKTCSFALLPRSSQWSESNVELQLLLRLFPPKVNHKTHETETIGPRPTFGLLPVVIVGEGESRPAKRTVRLFGAGLSVKSTSGSREPPRVNKEIFRDITEPVLT